MKQKETVVRCVFSESDVDLTQILQESFRLFISRVTADDGMVSFHDQLKLIPGGMACTWK